MVMSHQQKYTRLDYNGKRKIRLSLIQILTGALIFIVLLFLTIVGLLTSVSSSSHSHSAVQLSQKAINENVNVNMNVNGDVKSSRNSFHFVISSDCSSYQRWEVLTQLHSAESVHQCGRFTWIVSGCLDESSDARAGRGKGGANSDILTPSLLIQEVIQHFPHVTFTLSNHTVANTHLSHASGTQASSQSCLTIVPHLHFTPDYSDMSAYGGPYADGSIKRTFINRKGNIIHGNFGNTYKFNNKPNGLHHWIKHFLQIDDRKDEAVVLIDPDFLFLNKFELFNTFVEPRKPAAAKYGLGGQFLEFNRTRICNRALPIQKKSSHPSTPCPFESITNSDVNQYYSAGPPYVIHIQDVLALSQRWVQLVPPTYDEYPLLYAEMFAYSMAAADLDLKHTLVKHLYVGCMTSWPHYPDDGNALKVAATLYADLIQSNASSYDATAGGASSCFIPPLSPPPFLHYCSRYSFPTSVSTTDTTKSYHWFAKRHVDHTILDCMQHPQSLEPYKSNKPEKIEGGDEDWNTLAVCAIVRAINFAREKGCRK